MVDYDPKTYVPGIDTPKYDVEEIKKARKVLAEYTYEPSEIVKGYNSRSLYINVGTNEFKEKSRYRRYEAELHRRQGL